MADHLEKVIETIEESAIGSFLELVTKLNETTFKPLFVRLYDWAVIDLADDKSKDCLGSFSCCAELGNCTAIDDLRLVERKTVLLHVMMGLLERFKVERPFSGIYKRGLTLFWVASTLSLHRHPPSSYPGTSPCLRRWLTRGLFTMDPSASSPGQILRRGRWRLLDRRIASQDHAPARGSTIPLPRSRNMACRSLTRVPRWIYDIRDGSQIS